jgi:hypothetical protein
VPRSSGLTKCGYACISSAPCSTSEARHPFRDPTRSISRLSPFRQDTPLSLLSRRGVHAGKLADASIRGQRRWLAPWFRAYSTSPFLFPKIISIQSEPSPLWPPPWSRGLRLPMRVNSIEI